MIFLRNIYASWRDLLDNKSDPRVADWFLMSSPVPTTCLVLFYIYAVKIMLPKFMENRKPYKIRKILIVYNFLQTIFSIYIFSEAFLVGWGGNYNWRCEPVDYSMNEMALRAANACWWYFFSKFTEFFDTFFFILRKRFDQVSTLHVIHHAIMPFIWWGVKFTPGGHGTFCGFLNSFVHIVMYTYYMLAAIGPEMQKYLWWKKYLTILQMIQFVGIFIHGIQLFFYNPCNFPIAFVYCICGTAIMFMCLFLNFYIVTYSKNVKTKKIELDENLNEKKIL